MDLPDHLPPSTKRLIEHADEQLRLLSKLVLEGRKPPAGAYGFFHYSSHTLSRLGDCARILDRLYHQRAELSAAHAKEEQIRPVNWPPGTPYPADVNAVMKRSHELTQYMQLDMESLYIFGVTLLDQWSLQALSIGNVHTLRKHPFVELVAHLESDSASPLEPLWAALKPQLLWLHYQLRFYRNRFIIHPTRPWQGGKTAFLFVDYFNFFIPTPPGWLDDRALDEQIKTLLHLAPERIRNAPGDYWEKARTGRLIEVLFDDIAKYQKSDREKIAEFFGRKGGSTPSFQVIGSRLFEFLGAGTEILIDIAKANLANIDLGPPHHTSQEMWQERDDS